MKGGSIRHILIALLLACPVLAQTTQPTRQIEVQHDGKAVNVIVTAEVAGRVANGTQSDSDRAAVAVALELALGHLGEQKANPCHPKPSAVLEGPHPNNCTESGGK